MKEVISGINLLKDHWKDDLRAGFNVSLIALPLSLGIALASGFPPVAGLFAAIIGGMLVSRINGSFVTIVGPAAGLIVVNLGAIEVLGAGDHAAGYRYALAAIFVAGLMIVLLGWLKAGRFGDFFPISAVHGMLAAIGIIIMVKQFFVAVAVRTHGHEFYEVIEEIPVALFHSNPEVLLISVVSLLILIFHPRINSKMISIIPAPVWVLMVAIPLEFLMDFEHAHEVLFMGDIHKVGPQLLVHLPDNILDGFVFPDFGKIATAAFWVSVMAITLVTALESLLSALAVDSLDPLQRKTDLDKDLRGLGAGSSLSGLVGGLPMISEIVRSSANVSSGARTQWANFFHGVFLLLFLWVGAPLINHIPLAALAAMLLYTGFRLASPREFKHVYQIGKSELLIFVTTIVMVLLTDLLIGIGIGITINLLIHVWKGTKPSNLFKVQVREQVNGSGIVYKISRALVFSNYLGLKKRILKNADRPSVIDMARVTFIDHTVVNHLNKLTHELAAKGLSLEIINNEHLVPESDHPLAARRARAGITTSAVKSTGRQEALAHIAAAYGGMYTAAKSVDHHDWLKAFYFQRKGRIHYTSNHIYGKFSEISYHYQEIEFDAEVATQSATEKIPALILFSPRIAFPIFTMEKEEFFHRLVGFAGWEDIDFEDHQAFSDRFLLKGPNEAHIRAFFIPSLIRVLERVPDYHMESDGKHLLLYRLDKDVSVDGIEKLIRFGEILAPILRKIARTMPGKTHIPSGKSVGHGGQPG